MLNLQAPRLFGVPLAAIFHVAAMQLVKPLKVGKTVSNPDGVVDDCWNDIHRMDEKHRILRSTLCFE